MPILQLGIEFTWTDNLVPAGICLDIVRERLVGLRVYAPFDLVDIRRERAPVIDGLVQAVDAGQPRKNTCLDSVLEFRFIDRYIAFAGYISRNRIMLVLCKKFVVNACDESVDIVRKRHSVETEIDCSDFRDSVIVLFSGTYFDFSRNGRRDFGHDHRRQFSVIVGFQKIKNFLIGLKFIYCRRVID